MAVDSPDNFGLRDYSPGPGTVCLIKVYGFRLGCYSSEKDVQDDN